MVDRRSPTPPHNTRELQTWVDFAEAAETAIADYPVTEDVHALLCELREHQRVFADWVHHPDTRPPPGERSPQMTAFMGARSRAIDLLQRLAKQHPEIAQAALERHRREYERSKR